MAFVIRIHDYRGDPLPGENFVMFFDVEAYEGRGDLITTSKIDRAQRFESISEALAFWNTQSKLRPLRPDGLPNKPLTAFTVSVETAE